MSVEDEVDAGMRGDERVESVVDYCSSEATGVIFDEVFGGVAGKRNDDRAAG